MKRLLFFVLLLALAGLTSCGYNAPSTAVSCTTTTATSSSTTSTSTCTDPATNISVTISPATVSVNVVSTQQFQDFIQGGTNSITIWQVNSITGGNDSVGRIDSNGLYHAPVAVPSPATVSVSAVSFEDQKVSATSTVTVTPAPVVTITSPPIGSSPSCTNTSATPTPPACVTPAQSGASAANSVAFGATESGGSTNATLWYVGPVGGLGVLGGNSTFGTISASGVFTPPATPPLGQVVTVTAAAEDSPTSTAPLNVKISGYSTSSLGGPFAFSLSGGNASGHFFRAGSFTADGAGNLNSVIEDLNPAPGGAGNPIITTGAYSVGSDGRGQLSFNDGFTPAKFDFVLVNAGQLQIIGFDSSGTAAGQAIAQDISTFAGTPLSALSGTYVFDFAGVDGSNGLSQIGEFNADGAGNVTSGSIDINDGGIPSSFQIFGNKTVCTSPPSSRSTYSVSANGRGTLMLTTCAAGPTLTLNFYVASRGAAKFVGTDPVKQVAGYTSEQAPNATFDVTALNGNYAFLLAGSGLGGTIATAGSFFADGNGNLKSGLVDENVAAGAPAPGLPILPNPAGDNYTVAPNGRGTATFTTAGRTYKFVFYLGPVGSNTTAVFQETDSGVASDGNFTLQQSAAFTLASIQSNYAIEISGVSAGSLQVSTGQIAADGKGAVTSGNLDINTGGTLLTGQAVTGSYSAPAATGRATLALNSSTPNYAAYVLSPTQVYILGIQPAQLAVGALLRQF